MQYADGVLFPLYVSVLLGYVSMDYLNTNINHINPISSGVVDT